MALPARQRPTSHALPSGTSGILIGLIEPATGALALGKAFHQTLARSFRQKMSTGCDMENGELTAVFGEEWSLAISEAVLHDDEDATELALTGKMLVSAYLTPPARSGSPALSHSALDELASGESEGVVRLAARQVEDPSRNSNGLRRHPPACAALTWGSNIAHHELLQRREIPTMSRGVVYSISRAGASEMIGRGEYYSGSAEKAEPASGHVQHALELNDIHLALKRTGMLVRWTPESDIRSRNEFIGIGYVKDYDAAVAVRIDSHEYRFALDYERTPKAKGRYVDIWRRIEAEAEFRHFLYLVPNHDMLALLIRQFQDCHRSVHFGLKQDFLVNTLSLAVQSNHSPLSTTLCAVLTAEAYCSDRRRATSTTQAPLFTY